MKNHSKVIVWIIINLIVACKVVFAEKVTDKLNIFADFRYRHEVIDEEGKKESSRQRIRARVGITGKIQDSLELTFRIASGSSDPTSTNQTLDDSASTKTIGLDQAYFSWKATEFINGLTINGGKAKNPFYLPGNSDIIWDGDITPEGLSVLYKTKSDKFTPFVNLAGFWVEERSSSSDSIMYGVQSGVGYEFADKSEVIAGTSFYLWTNTKGYPPFYDPTKGMGNTLSSGNYAENFREIELFAVYKFRTCSLPFSVFGDYVTNTGADDNNNGWLFGFSIGEAKQANSWKVSYNYRRLEADSVVGVWTDSDVSGGGTDMKGNKLDFTYMLTDYASIGITVHISEKGLSNSKDYNRGQLDFQVKF